MKDNVNLPVSSGVGVTTLFSVLLILSLTVFAVLAYASAQADLRLTKKNADMVSAYYEADSAAARIGADILSFWPEGAIKPKYEDCLVLENSILDSDARVFYASVSEKDSGLEIFYSIETDTRLSLDVMLYMPRGGLMEIRSWKLIAPDQIVDDESMPVWQG
jgi:hypothetical protein